MELPNKLSPVFWLINELPSFSTSTKQKQVVQ